MKIEMGESLLQSYLKYEKGSLITQTNWKTASSWAIANEDYEKVEFVFNKIQNHADFSDVFKKSSLEQALKQAEVDVVGIDKDKVYLVEVAFHENGLQYGGRLETKDRVCKKLLDIFGLLKFDDVAPVTSGGYAAAPFDSPAETPATAAVLPKANFTGNTAIEFVSPGEGQFRRLLLQKKCAKRTLIYRMEEQSQNYGMPITSRNPQV